MSLGQGSFDALMSGITGGAFDPTLAAKWDAQLSAQLQAIQPAAWARPGNEDDYEDHVGLLAGYIARIRSATGTQTTKEQVRQEFGK